MRSQQAKLSFSSGVMTPRLSLRSDLDRYSTGLRQSINFIVSPQGGAVFREGFQNLAQVFKNRLFQFHQGGDDHDILIEIRPGSTIFWKNPSYPATPYLTLTNIYLEADLENLYFTNQETTAVILHPDYPPYYIEEDANGLVTAEYLPNRLIPLVDYKDVNSPTSSMTTSFDYTAEWVDGTDLWKDGREWTLRYDGVYATGNQGNIKEFNFQTTSADMLAKIELALSFIPAISGPDTTVTVTEDTHPKYNIVIAGLNGGKTLQINRVDNFRDYFVDVVNPAVDDTNQTLEPAWSYPTYVFHVANYYQCIAPHTSETGVIEPPDAAYWVDLGTTKPDTFDWQYPDGNVWADGVIYAPHGRGFPTVGAIHQQRLLLMANASVTMGIWGSRLNQFKDFTLGPEDDDPFFFTIDTSDTPTIKWAESQRHLTIGTSSGDFMLRGEVTLTPSDVNALKQNNARSFKTRAVTTNTDIIYIEQGNEKIRTTSYLRDPDAMTSKDISLIAENLLHTKVKRLVILHTPELMVVALRFDGSMVAVSFAPDFNVAAWFELESAGFVHDIAGNYKITTEADGTISGEDGIFATIMHGDNYFLERMPYPSRTMTPKLEESDPSLTEQGVVCLDSWVTGTIVTGDANVITGLDHLEGLEVAALVDDAWTGIYTVQSGTIILTSEEDIENYDGEYAVGRLYKGTLETFEHNAGNARGVGFGTKRRWNRLWIRLLDSALPIINGTLPPDRTPETEMNLAEILRMGVQDVDIRGLGWGDGSILIEQDRPYPTHVLGLYGEFNVNNA